MMTVRLRVVVHVLSMVVLLLMTGIEECRHDQSVERLMQVF
jgi:hypothetical protein